MHQASRREGPGGRLRQRAWWPPSDGHREQGSESDAPASDPGPASAEVADRCFREQALPRAAPPGPGGQAKPRRDIGDPGSQHSASGGPTP